MKLLSFLNPTTDTCNDDICEKQAYKDPSNYFELEHKEYWQFLRVLLQHIDETQARKIIMCLVDEIKKDNRTEDDLKFSDNVEQAILQFLIDNQ